MHHGASAPLRCERMLNYRASFKPKTDTDGIVHLFHDAVVKMSHFFLETLFVDGAYLLKQDNGILGKTEAVRKNIDMGG